MAYGNGVTNQYQYDSLNRLTNLTWNLNFTALAKFSYLLGATGNRTNLNEAFGSTNRIYTWQYDHLYRLTNEAVSVTAPGSLFYQYDSVGNRTNRSGSLGTLAGQALAYNANDWLTNTDQYDSNGNTTNSSGNSYQYDAMNRVTNAIVNGIQILIAYDGDGNRVSKTIGGTTTYYLIDDLNPSGYSQVLEEYRGSVLTNVYNYGLGLISQRQPGVSTNYFISDGHGSTRMLTDNGGTVVNVLVYDAFGNLVASNGVLQTAYLYCGQQFDPVLGLYYNRARYLNMGTGRFWTADSTDGNNEDPLSLHKYLYVEDDPVDKDDPLGLSPADDGTYTTDEGDAVHALIQRQYLSEQGTNRATCTTGTPAGIGKNPRLKPDILNRGAKTYAEIKPLSLSGIIGGFNRLNTYSASLRGLGYKRDPWPSGTYRPIRTGFVEFSPYFYFNVRGLILYTQIDPSIVAPFIILGPTTSKAALKELAIRSAQRMALRGATTLTEAVAPEVGLVGTVETADVGVTAATGL